MGDDIDMLKAAIEKAAKKNVSVKSAQKVRRPYHLKSGPSHALVLPISGVACRAPVALSSFLFVSVLLAPEETSASGIGEEGACDCQGESRKRRPVCIHF